MRCKTYVHPVREPENAAQRRGVEIHRQLERRYVALAIVEGCVICQNEGAHEADRPHVMEGQE